MTIIIVCTKHHQPAALANIMPPVTAKQRVVIIPGDQPEERNRRLRKERFWEKESV